MEQVLCLSIFHSPRELWREILSDMEKFRKFPFLFISAILIGNLCRKFKIVDLVGALVSAGEACGIAYFRIGKSPPFGGPGVEFRIIFIYQR